jgi:predicted CxxxxCH...CXXCH cytochrome family protein
MKIFITHLLWLASLITAGCNSGTGPDSLFSQQTPGSGIISSCTEKCHNASSTISPDPIATNGTGTYGKHVAHVQNTGIPCEKCHAGYYTAPTHMNGQLDTGPAVNLVYFDSTNPPPAQFDKNAGPPVTGICSNLACHGSDMLDWYGTGTANFQNCGSCHSFTIGTRRRITGTQGDFGGNASIVSRHVTTTGDPAREQCLVCHDQSTHTAGTVRLRHADTGASMAYDPLNPAALEPFCLSCHDADGATATLIPGGTSINPFNDGSALGTPPYAYAARIANSWGKSYGHGPNGNHATAKKLTCLGSGQPGTGCHGNSGTINAHGSMNQVLAARSFKYDNSSAVYTAAEFDLCFACHANYPGFTKEDTLGVKQNGLLDGDYGWLAGGNGPNGWNPPYYTLGVTTRFADHNESGGAYNDATTWWGPNANLHWAHLGFPSSEFRGTGTITGINCVNCHDVHGSMTPSGALYDEIGYTHVFPDAVNILGKMTDNAYLLNQLDLHPTYCAGFNCHPMQGPTRAWFSPITE